MDNIAERIKERRKALGFTQGNLAKLAKVSQGMIANIESGYRKEPRKILEIAAALGVSPDWLRFGKNTSISINSPFNVQKKTWPFDSISLHDWNTLPKEKKLDIETFIMALVNRQQTIPTSTLDDEAKKKRRSTF